ncbi:DUF3800 domain-containing protein [Marinitenerispora sediminis]|uniref:DUF3800 domain-containing protein n=1 Tax=Marinitenerispora sediminis TaxID=1931232 RepID=UPI001314DDBA|nr:DUF3800 domain-containing protein [Marinitenerispora sediminis]
MSLADPRATARKDSLPRLYVYIDETGDRGFADRSSAFFAMTALLVPEESDWLMRYATGGLRALIQTDKPLHWVEHFRRKHPERRIRAAEVLARLPDVSVLHVVADKATIHQDAGIRTNKDRFYNYLTKLVMERVALSAATWPGGPRSAIVRLGAVKQMDHKETLRYLELVRDRGSRFVVPWDHIKWPPKWLGTDWDGIQIADLYAGMLHTALSGDVTDPSCAALFVRCGHQIRRGPRGQLLGYGIEIVGDESFVTKRCWWRDLAGADV